MSLDKFEKQPIEVDDFDMSFVDYLTAKADTIFSHVVSADPGITVVSSTAANGIVKVWLSGGTDGVTYKVTSTITTTGGRVRQHEALYKIKEK